MERDVGYGYTTHASATILGSTIVAIVMHEVVGSTPALGKKLQGIDHDGS